MANLHLITGYAGAEHITAADHGSMNIALLGSGQYVLNRGNKFAATVVTGNLIRIADGDLLMQGRHIRLNEDTYVELSIENGTQGYYRNDLIVARYTKNSATGIEEANLVVIKGTPATSSPADPDYTVGDLITDHDLQNDMPLYRIPLNGITVGTPVALFDEATVFLTSEHNTDETAHTNKADKVSGATNGNFAALNASGNIVDSGKKHGDFVPSTRKINGKPLNTDISLTLEDIGGTIEDITTITATATLALTYGGKILKVNSASGVTISIPAHSTANFPVGSCIEVLRYGAGAVTIQAVDAVSLNGVAGGAATVADQFTSIVLLCVAQNEWTAQGSIADE